MSRENRAVSSGSLLTDPIDNAFEVGNRIAMAMNAAKQSFGTRQTQSWSGNYKSSML